MKSILVTYPNFRTLPKGLKQLLLASESFFFNETKTAADKQGPVRPIISMVKFGNERLGSILHPEWKN